MIDVFSQNPHRRWNPLKREWVLVSPHRAQCPWQGQMEETNRPAELRYDPACYLCPGNTRAGGHQPPAYTGTFVFENDYAALKQDVLDATMDVEGAGLLHASTERGTCRVLCFDPRHDLTLATMSLSGVERVIDIWAEQEAELAARSDVGYVQIFENRGAMMGSSNPHPHGQIWATEHVPNEAALEGITQSEYLAEHGTSLLADYLALELERGERVVAQNAGWVALVPFWAVCLLSCCCYHVCLSPHCVG